MTTQSQPADETILRFVAKLESFAATLTDDERELLRVALGIGAVNGGNDVRGYLG